MIKDKKAPVFLGKQPMAKVLEVGAKGIASIIFGDTTYNNNLITLRVFESILSGCITFIDNDFDVKHQIFDNDFMYVNNGDELEEKIIKVKNDPDLKKTLIDCQNRYFYKIREEKHLAKILNEIIG
jgi:alpha-N-acetylglucosamine transferase